MKKILTVHLRTFNNEEHYEFLVVLRDLIQKYPAAQAALTVYGNSLIEQIEKEKELINVMQKSDYTQSIADADQRIDRTITGMNQIIAANLHHFSLENVEAARILQNRFKAFGRITQKSYEEEIADVTILLEDLRNDMYAGAITLTGLAPWLTELTEVEATFEYLLRQRNTEYAQKPQNRLRSVRRDSDILYHRMIDRIEASATLDTTHLYDAFINELNARINYFNDHAHHHARKNIGVGDDCALEPVPVQLYTGKAVTPLPKAFYRETGKPTVELIFARDFFVTYRNNIDVGTADLILHGKGAYRGQKKTTFNITRTV
jgi:hypothetical protein